MISLLVALAALLCVAVSITVSSGDSPESCYEAPPALKGTVVTINNVLQPNGKHLYLYPLFSVLEDSTPFLDLGD